MVISLHVPTTIIKRDGTEVRFDQSKIYKALVKCYQSTYGYGVFLPKSVAEKIERLTSRVMNILATKSDVPTVEQVQDLVVIVLQAEGEYDAAESYIIYRYERTKKRDAEYIPQEIINKFKASEKYFPTALQYVQYYDKYAKYNYDLGRRETWEETVERTIEFLSYLIDSAWEKAGIVPDMERVMLKQEYLDRIRNGILAMEVVPSMRLLAMAGPAAIRDNAVIYNCSYLPLDSIESFCELMSNSMAGCGVGYSVESFNTEQLPVVGTRNTQVEQYIVEDSAEGWVDALRFGLICWFTGSRVEYDFDAIRSKGAILKTKGGRASGKEPLRDMLQWIEDKILGKAGKKLTTLDCHDIACTIGNAVVSGGVRRTALISIYDVDDELMNNCKIGDFEQDNSQRWNANNSAVWTDVENMTQLEFLRRMWPMFQSERGEPGIFSRENAIKYMPERRQQNNRSVRIGTNPCFHPDTVIETVNGPQKIKDIVKPTYVYSMDENQKLVIRKASAAWVTRRNTSTVKIALSNGKDLIVTPEHLIYVLGKGWTEAGNLRGGERVVGLTRNRRGAAYAGVKLTTQNRNEYIMEHRLIWEGVNGVIPEGYDIHHKDNNTYNNDINNLQLLEHGIHARLTKLTRANNHQVKDEVTGKFVITTLEPGKKIIVNMPKQLKTNWHQYATVIYVSNGPTTDVYDISVEDTHNVVANGIIAHNCGEINLRPFQFCNLSAVVARNTDTRQTLFDKVFLATLIGTIQSTATYFPNLRDIWKVNCEAERLLGVDITGQLDCTLLLEGNTHHLLEDLRGYAQKVNKSFAEFLGINPSAAITCVKPSGNSAVLLDCSSGLHPRWAKYYIRNIRLNASSPLVKVLQDSGYTLSPENGQDPENPNTWVVSFPIKAPDGAIVRDDWNVIDQCEWWKTNKLYWTEHNPSVTIYYSKQEILPLLDWLWENRTIIGGMAFLPRSDAKYDQLPYIEITEEEYEERKAALKPIQMERLYLHEKSDHSTATQELTCEGALCEYVPPAR